MSKGYGFIIPNQSQYPQEQQQQQHELTPYKKPSSSSAINESKPNRVQEGLCVCFTVGQMSNHGI